jgi:hypothetical protein
MYCHRCGKELPVDATYCANCGARVGEYSPADRYWEWRRERRHEWDPIDAIWGAVRALGFLIIIGLTIAFYPNVITLTIKYLESWGTYGHPVLPGEALGKALIFLFAASGVWGIISAGMTLLFSSRVRRPLRNVVGGVFALYFAFLLSQFYGKGITGAGLVLAFFIGLAIMVLVNAIISFIFPRRKPTKTEAPS